MAADPQVIVVGGGHNGLICAAYLARAGASVTLVEARDTVGGCASTVDALGARVNICNCDHMAIRSLPLTEELNLDQHGLRYIDLEPAYIGHSWTPERPVVLFSELDRTLESLALTHPDQVDGYRAYVRAAQPVARLLIELAADTPTPGNVWQGVTRRRGAGLARLLWWSRRSVAGVLRRYLSSETLLGTAIASGPALWGLSPHTPGTGLGALRFAMLHTVPVGRPVGGSGALTDAVAASFEAAGGAIVTSTRVERLLVEEGRIRGIRTSDGRELVAPTVVVAYDPRVALLEWLDDVPPAAASMIDRWRAKPSHEGYESKIDAVVADAPRHADLDERLMGRLGLSQPLGTTKYLSPSLDGIAAALREAEGGRVAARPIMLANTPSVADPTMIPPGGGHVFSLEVLFTPYKLAGGWPSATEPWRWLETFARTTTAPAEFLDGIRDWRAMTPDRYETDFGMRLGYTPAFAGGPLAALLAREPELSRYRTPISGLFFTGAATFPGAGVWGAPGRNAAQVVLEHLDQPVGARSARR